MDYPISDPSIGLVGGRFVDENLVTGTPGSIIAAAWANSLMSECLAIIAHAGLDPDEDILDQMAQAIWTPAAEGFAGVAKLASVEEAEAGLDAFKIITPFTLAAALSAMVPGIPGATFSDVDALTADAGPIIVTDMAGQVWSWVNTAYFQGYRNPLCGMIPQHFAPTPRAWEMPVTGGVWSDSDPKQKRLIALFREYGHVVAIGDWLPGWGRIADLGGGSWKAPDLQNVFLRIAGTDADTANPRMVGSYQSDALQNIVGDAGSVQFWGDIPPSGPFIKGPNKGTLAGGGSASAMLSFNAGAAVRTSSETRGPNVTIAPVILI